LSRDGDETCGVIRMVYGIVTVPMVIL